MYRKGENIGYQAEDGIWMDYDSHIWYFVIKDRTWQKEEIRNANKNHITVSLIRKGCVDAFLLEIEDCLETSDIPFCIKDADETIYDALQENVPESYAVVLVDEAGVVQSVRTHAFSPENSALLKEKLLERKDEGYTSENFDAAYSKLAGMYEPFEMEQFALFMERDGRK
ncbi:MAG: hypothetical protein ACI32N_06095 [Bulleidia sp.]